MKISVRYLRALLTIAVSIFATDAQAIDRFDFLGVEAWDAETLPSGTKLFTAELLAEQEGRVDGVMSSRASWSAPRLGLGLSLGRFADFHLVADLYGGLSEDVASGGTMIRHGSRSPRSWVKFHVLDQREWTPSLGLALGFKWPAANEPFEVDEGDFLFQLLASKKWQSTELHFNTGPVIYGDSSRNSAQLHTWNYSFRVSQSFGAMPPGALSAAHRLDAELHFAQWLPGSWIAFWNTGSSALNRSRVSLSYRHPWGEGHQLWVRATQTLISAGTQRSIAVGYAYNWGFEPQLLH